MTDNRPVLVLGPGRLSFNIIDYFRLATDRRVEGFVYDVDRAQTPKDIDGLPVYPVDAIEGMAESHVELCYLGNPERRIKPRSSKAIKAS